MAILLLLFTACREKPKNPAAEYGDALIRAKDRSSQVVEQTDIEAVKRALREYNAANGRYPSELRDIEQMVGKTIDPNRFDYDPESGYVSLRPTR